MPAQVQFGTQTLEASISAEILHRKTNAFIPPENSDLDLFVSVERDYLHITHDEMSTANRSLTDKIFAIRNGKLLDLGNVWHVDSAMTITDKMRKIIAGGFIDLDNQPETNDLVGHAQSPLMQVVVHENHKRLVYDGKATCEFNAYKDRLGPKDFRPSGGEAEAEFSHDAGWFLARAICQKYCGTLL